MAIIYDNILKFSKIFFDKLFLSLFNTGDSIYYGPIYNAALNMRFISILSLSLIFESLILYLRFRLFHSAIMI